MSITSRDWVVWLLLMIHRDANSTNNEEEGDFFILGRAVVDRLENGGDNFLPRDRCLA